jgi:outer membrane receptor protein involved in Fe transport
MRSAAAKPARWSPMRWAKRVAQVAPADDPAPASADSSTQPADPQPAPTPAADPAAAPEPAPVAEPAAPPAVEPAPAAPQAPAAAPAASVSAQQTPELSDEEMAKLSEQSAKTEIITVTGSTIERKTLTTPAPLTMLNRDELTAAGRATVGDILQRLPEQSNAINAQANNGGDGTTRISIRGLGANRTLTLLNGRRVVAGGSGANTSVDLNAIPLAMIERVEVLKDGASAVYGSDAIGGVVNIITRNDFNGTETALYTGGAGHGDGFTYDGSFITGYTSQDKKGNIIFSAGIQSQNAVMAGDRSFSSHTRQWNYTTHAEEPNNLTTALGGYLNAKAGVGDKTPHNICGVGVDFCTADGMGGFRPFNDAADRYNPQPDNYLYTPASRYNVYSGGTYKLVPQASTFFEASYLNRTSDQLLAPTPFNSAATISKDSMYNPIHQDVFDYQRRLAEFGDRQFFQEVDTFRIVGGFQGAVPEDVPVVHDWKWEASYNYGRSGALNRSTGNLIKSRLAQSLGPSMRDGNGNPICVRTANMANTAIAGCVPINILGGAGSIDPAAANWLTFTGVSGGFNEQQIALAQGHGKLMDLPNHGDISMAVGSDFRVESGGTNPDPLTATGDTTGNASQPTNGKYRVTEGFAELSVVPVSGEKYAEWVELSLAARAFHYSTFGNGVTWKAGGLFRTANGVALRGTYSTAFRAPSIPDLYRGTADSFPLNNDPCNTAGGTKPLMPGSIAEAKCLEQNVPLSTGPTYADKQQRTVIGGNTKLDAETAKTLTAGVVFEPPQVKGLSLTADYWKIDINNAIQALPASVILSNCYQQGLEDYCMQIHRNPALNYKIDYINNITQNVGGTSTSGLDLAVAFDRSFPGIGRFRQALETQRLFKYNVDNTVQVLHYRGNYDLGVFPKWKTNFNEQWVHPSGLAAGFNVQYIGSFKECNNQDCNHNQPSRPVQAWAKVDVSGNYTMKSRAGTTNIGVGVNNVMNSNPALIYSGFAGSSDSSTYDYMGRFVYMRLAQLF